MPSQFNLPLKVLSIRLCKQSPIPLSLSPHGPPASKVRFAHQNLSGLRFVLYLAQKVGGLLGGGALLLGALSSPQKFGPIAETAAPEENRCLHKTISLSKNLEPGIEHKLSKLTEPKHSAAYS
jgi:hypothetical protein